MRDNIRSELTANLELQNMDLVKKTPSWQDPSRCKRPPVIVTLPPSLFDRILRFIGL